MAVGALIALACGASAGSASAQTIEPPFNAQYSVVDLGPPPGVPARLGGLTLLAGDQNTLLIGGEANTSTGALYAVRVTRNAQGHITGFSGTATRFADAPFNDGGVSYGPGGVLFVARWPSNELGQIRPGSGTTDKVIDMSQFGVESSLVALAFVPPGFPGAGSLKLSSYGGGAWYDAGLTPDATGTYDLTGVTEVPASRLGGGPVGYVYVPAGSSQFANPSMLVAEYQAGNVAAYELDADGNPRVPTRRTFLSGLTGADGAFIDPVTDDFLFSTFGGGDRVVVVRGFGANPVLGVSASVAPVRGDVRVRLPGGRFVPLEQSRQVPIGSFLDTRRGIVRLISARNRAGNKQSGVFRSGVFQVRQSRKASARGLTELRLGGAGFGACGAGGRLSGWGGEAARGSKRVVRRLQASARGRFRSRGRYSAATVRGTDWTVTDRCDGTLTRVSRGRVSVRDFRRGRTIILGRGDSYLARAP